MISGDKKKLWRVDLLNLDAENQFNINDVLKKIYKKLDETCQKEGIELLYEMERTVPKLLRGNSEILITFFTKLLKVFLEHAEKKEIVLILSAPEDFMYEEPVTFEIKYSDSFRDTLNVFAAENLGEEISVLCGELTQSKDGNFSISFPLTIHELGFRRHYRLSSTKMLDKKVLLITKSQEFGEGIRTHFQYFRNSVTIAPNEEGIDLDSYDILISSKEYLTNGLKEKIIAANRGGLMVVWIGADHGLGDDQSVITTRIYKPVTQESIYLLIETLYEYMNNSPKEIEEPPKEEKEEEGESLISLIKKNNSETHSTLDRSSGEIHCVEEGLIFKSQLKKFLSDYENSSVTLQNLIMEEDFDELLHFTEKATHQAYLIGAQELHSILGLIQMILLYKEYNFLTIYSAKYRKELSKLVEEIKLIL